MLISTSYNALYSCCHITVFCHFIAPHPLHYRHLKSPRFNQFLFIFCRMAGKFVSLRFFYEGVFRKTTYSGGQHLLVNRLDVDEVSYTVLMEYVMEYLHYTEIGGVYVWNEISRGWKLVKDDADLMELVNGCENNGEIPLYVDNFVDKEIEPLIQGQPHVVIRPRKNLVQGINI